MSTPSGSPDLAAKAQETVASAQDTEAAAASELPEFKGRTATHVIIYGGEFGAPCASCTDQTGLINADFLLLGTFEEDSEE